MIRVISIVRIFIYKYIKPTSSSDEHEYVLTVAFSLLGLWHE